LLDSYEPERIAFARRLVATTDQAFTGVISTSAVARFVRTKALPAIAPVLFRIPAMRKFMFRTVSQTSVNYRDSPLSEGHAGRLRGGDRLPWVSSADGAASNFEALAAMNWQVHVYGIAAPELRELSDRRRIPLHAFAWRAAMKRAGLQRNAVYLVRPDGYVALADSRGGATAIGAYLDKNKIAPGT
jgi:hypothetical protein